VDEQPDVGQDGYDAGAKILKTFFDEELKKFLVPELNEVGRRIIECCLDNGTVKDYEALL
jgi:hypothetical protein